jgi:sugar phosphate isomerase/epimerase
MFKLGCGEWGFRELPVEEHFRVCKELGFDVMEFGIGGGKRGRLPEAPDRATIRDFHALSRRYEIDTPFCCVENDFTLASPTEPEALLERTLRSLADAARCGATHVRLFAGFRPFAEMNEATWRQMLDAFDACQNLAERLYLKLCIETHGTIRQDDGAAIHTHTVSTHTDGLQRLLRELPEGIAFNWDPGNCKACEPEDRACKLDVLAGHIDYCHLKDWLPHGDGWRAAAPGDGDIDYLWLLPQLEFDGPLLIEYEPTEDVEVGLRRSLAQLWKVARP